MSAKRKNDDDENNSLTPAFAGFQISKAVKRQKVSKADEFKRASRSAAADAPDEGDDRPQLPKDFAIPMSRESKWRLAAQKRKGDEKSLQEKLNGVTSDRDKDTVMNDVNQDEDEDEELPPPEIPQILADRVAALKDCRDETEKFKRAVSMSAEDVDVHSETFKSVPVSAFGEALLRGMGWKGKDSKVGRTNAAVTRPVEFIPRGDRQGLGAEIVQEEQKRKDGRRWINKPGESNQPRQLMRVKPDADGKVRHHAAPGEELIPVANTTPRRNALVEIHSGKHKGLFGRITQLSDDRCTIRLNISEEEISTSLYRIEVLDEHALPVGHAAFSTRHTSSRGRSDRHSRANGHHDSSSSGRNRDSFRDGDRRDRDSERPRDRDRKRDRRRDRDDSQRFRSRSPEGSSRRSNGSTKTEKRGSTSKREKLEDKYNSRADSRREKVPRITWVVPHIRVRIISKTLKNGVFYCKKGRVEDVVSPFEFLVVMDTGETLEGIHESDVETVVPKKGKRVLVVAGKHKGARGVLMEKNTKKEKAVVQLSSNLDVLKCTLNDICEFVGSGHAHDDDLH